MSGLGRNWRGGFCAWAILGTSGFAVDVELIPVGGVGNEIIVRPGTRVQVDVRVSNWGSQSLQAVEAVLDRASLTSAATGSLSIFNPDIDGDGICDAGSEQYCTACYENTTPTHHLKGIFVDECRADHLAHIAPIVQGLWAVDPDRLRFVWGRRSGGVTDPGDRSYYTGSFVVQVSPDARGTFELELTAEHVPGAGATVVAQPYPADDILPMNLFGALIHVGKAAYGDVNGDEVVDLKDILCVLDGVGGEYPRCPFDAVNLEPCERGTAIDVHDLVGVLDAFMGSDQCYENR